MGTIIPKMGTIKPLHTTLLFSKVQQLILKLLYLNYNSDFYTNEIIRIINCGRGAVQRELEKLTEAGLITVKLVGNQKHYQANQSLPYYSELRSIVIKTFGLTDYLREALQHLGMNKIKIGFIYGSFAKQTDNENSDIDLMLIGNDLTYADTYQALAETEVNLGRKINPSFYSIEDWTIRKKDGNNFIKKIIEQPKIFLIGDEGELKELR